MNRTFLQAMLRSGFILLFLFSVSFTAQAQQIPEAQVQDNLTITLDTDSALSETYTVDMSAYASNMTDQASADQLADLFERPYTECSIEYSTLTMTINLDTGNVVTNNWSVAEWNQHLKTN